MSSTRTLRSRLNDLRWRMRLRRDRLSASPLPWALAIAVLIVLGFAGFRQPARHSSGDAPFTARDAPLTTGDVPAGAVSDDRPPPATRPGGSRSAVAVADRAPVPLEVGDLVDLYGVADDGGVVRLVEGAEVLSLDPSVTVALERRDTARVLEERLAGTLSLVAPVG